MTKLHFSLLELQRKKASKSVLNITNATVPVVICRECDESETIGLKSII